MKLARAIQIAECINCVPGLVELLQSDQLPGNLKPERQVLGNPLDRRLVDLHRLVRLADCQMQAGQAHIEERRLRRAFDSQRNGFCPETDNLFGNRVLSACDPLLNETNGDSCSQQKQRRFGVVRFDKPARIRFGIDETVASKQKLGQRAGGHFIRLLTAQKPGNDPIGSLPVTGGLVEPGELPIRTRMKGFHADGAVIVTNGSRPLFS